MPPTTVLSPPPLTPPVQGPWSSSLCPSATHHCPVAPSSHTTCPGPVVISLCPSATHHCPVAPSSHTTCPGPVVILPLSICNTPLSCRPLLSHHLSRARGHPPSVHLQHTTVLSPPPLTPPVQGPWSSSLCPSATHHCPVAPSSHTTCPGPVVILPLSICNSQEAGGHSATSTTVGDGGGNYGNDNYDVLLSPP